MDEQALIWLIAATTLGLGVGFYFWGRSSGSPSTPVTVGTVNTEADCAEACRQFESARQAQCRASSAEEAARNEMEARRTDYWAAFGAWVGLSTAAAAAIALPWPANLIVGLALATAATVALGVTLFLLGKLNAASAAWSDASAVLNLANEAVLSARTVILAKCPEDRANACLGVPPPC